MIITTAQMASWVGAFMWPFIRVSAMLIVVPFFSSRIIPVRVRVFTSFILAVSIAPYIYQPILVDPLSLPALSIAVDQLLIGITMGFILQMVFSALVIAGQGIAMGMGLGFAQMTDPQSGVNVPVVSNFFLVTATIMFLSLNGHVAIIQMLMKSFELMPINQAHYESGDFMRVVAWGKQMYIGAVLIALPAFAAMLMTNFGFGVITRAAPQLNIFAVGFPMTITLGFFVMTVNFSNIMARFIELLEEGFELVEKFLYL